MGPLGPMIAGVEKSVKVPGLAGEIDHFERRSHLRSTIKILITGLIGCQDNRPQAGNGHGRTGNFGWPTFNTQLDRQSATRLRNGDFKLRSSHGLCTDRSERVYDLLGFARGNPESHGGSLGVGISLYLAQGRNPGCGRIVIASPDRTRLLGCGKSLCPLGHIEVVPLNGAKG